MKIELPPTLNGVWDWLDSTEEQSYITVRFGYHEIATIPAVRKQNKWETDIEHERNVIIEESIAEWLRGKLT